MSANIPLEIQVEVMKRAPVKSLVRFRSVSKRYKYLIDSSKFIGDHSVNQHHLLVCYKVDSEAKFDLIADDDSFPHRKFSLKVSLTIDFVTAFMVGCCHGLVCLFGWDRRDMTKTLVVVWNPSIRKSVVIAVPYIFAVLGFGVCPKTSDPKIVKITGCSSMDFKAEVFRLSFGVWKSVPMNLPYKLIEFISNQVVLDGAIYWVVYVRIPKHESTRIRILSFDLTSEEFRERELPDCLTCQIQLPINLARPNLFLSELNKSLVVLNYRKDDDGKRVCEVWKMLKSDASFTRLYTVPDLAFYEIIGFRKTSQPIIYRRDGSSKTELEAYQRSSKHINGLGIYGSLFQMASYTESLLLLNHTCSKSYYPFSF